MSSKINLETYNIMRPIYIYLTVSKVYIYKLRALYIFILEAQYVQLHKIELNIC
jgi:hypothetical protein